MEFIRARKPGLSLDLAPLIDVVFLLLIFFMLSSSFLSPSIKLELPKAVTGDRTAPEHILVSGDENGNLFINTRAVTASNLETELRALLAEDTGRSVHLKGDRAMPYKYFVEIMDAARRAGAEKIHIVHQPAEAA